MTSGGGDRWQETESRTLLGAERCEVANLERMQQAECLGRVRCGYCQVVPLASARSVLCPQAPVLPFPRVLPAPTGRQVLARNRPLVALHPALRAPVARGDSRGGFAWSLLSLRSEVLSVKARCPCTPAACELRLGARERGALRFLEGLPSSRAAVTEVEVCSLAPHTYVEGRPAPRLPMLTGAPQSRGCVQAPWSSCLTSDL